MMKDIKIPNSFQKTITATAKNICNRTFHSSINFYDIRDGSKVLRSLTLHENYSSEGDQKAKVKSMMSRKRLFVE